MKKLLYVCCVCVFAIFLSACTKPRTTYTLEQGRYVLEGVEKDEVSTPYLLVQDDNLVVIQDIAVSYQPSGKVEVNENEVVMKTKFLDEEENQWTFTLIADNKLQFEMNKSNLPAICKDWKDGMVFVRVEE